MYIIIWRHSYPDPHIHLDDHGFKATFESFEDAKQEAEEVLETEGRNEYHFDYRIYMQQVD